MKKIACHYAIVRFMPFIETGEFANVGIVAISPKHRFFGYHIMTKKHGRITRFFNELEARFFRSAMNDLKVELDRVHQVLKSHGFDRRFKSNDVDFARRLFSEVLRTRETVIRFSEQRVILAEDPKSAIRKLYSFYVDRDFVTKKYRETILENRLRKLLLTRQIADRFEKAKVGDDEYQVAFPFVEHRENIPTKIIKPLSLEQDDSIRIIEHGGKWEFRIKELRKRRCLPNNVLFAIQGPNGNDDRRQNAYLEACSLIQETGVTVAHYSDQNKILDFAVHVN